MWVLLVKGDILNIYTLGKPYKVTLKVSKRQKPRKVRNRRRQQLFGDIGKIFEA